MKARPFPKKKSSLRLQLAVQHTALSRRALGDRRLRRVARNALLVARQTGRVGIALAFVGDDAMRRLNRAYAGNDYVTDVLSFSTRENADHWRTLATHENFLGDIVIALPQAARQARTAGQPLVREVDFLLAHGVLHLLGYDHVDERTTKQMRLLEQRALQTS